MSVCLSVKKKSSGRQDVYLPACLPSHQQTVTESECERVCLHDTANNWKEGKDWLCVCVCVGVWVAVGGTLRAPERVSVCVWEREDKAKGNSVTHCNSVPETAAPFAFTQKASKVSHSAWHPPLNWDALEPLSTMLALSNELFGTYCSLPKVALARKCWFSVIDSAVSVCVSGVCVCPAVKRSEKSLAVNGERRRKEKECSNREILDQEERS